MSDEHSTNGTSAGKNASADRHRFAIVTPSYYVDFEHCRWLVETVNRYVPEDVPHYLIVDRADRDLFAPLRSSRTRVLFKEDVLRGRLRQVPFARRWWVGLKMPPVRGWIVQQLTKLFVSEVVEEDVLIFVDSGCFFVRPFDPRSMVKDGQVRLFRESGDWFRNKMTRRWTKLSSRLLGLHPPAEYPVGYVTQLVTWRRDNLIKLQKHIELVAGKPALEHLARQVTLSEYYVYGIYCDLVLGDRSGHYYTSIMSSLCHWGVNTLTEAELVAFRGELTPDHVLVLVNEKSRTSLHAVRNAFSQES
jgi:hypothetical protein